MPALKSTNSFLSKPCEGIRTALYAASQHASAAAFVPTPDDVARTHSKPRYFRMILPGRSGKKNPRMGIDFMKWADADSVINIISHVYAYAQHIWIRKRRAAKNTSAVSSIGRERRRFCAGS